MSAADIVDAAIRSLRDASAAGAHHALEREVEGVDLLQADLCRRHAGRADRLKGYFAALRAELDAVRQAVGGPDPHDRIAGAVRYERRKRVLLAKINGCLKSRDGPDPEFDQRILALHSAALAAGASSRGIAALIVARCATDRNPLRKNGRAVFGATAERIVRRRLRELDSSERKAPFVRQIE